jgi:quinol monooxygenase YgiN
MSKEGQTQRKESISVQQHVYKEGFLSKRGKYGLGINMMKRRYFVLAGDILLYYPTKESYTQHEHQKGAIVLRDAKSIKPDGTNKFSMELPFRTYFFAADSDKTVNDWVKVLQEAVARIHRQEKARPKLKAKLAATTVLGNVRQEKLQKDLEQTTAVLETTKKTLSEKYSDLNESKKNIEILNLKLKESNDASDDLSRQLQTSKENGEKLSEELAKCQAELAKVQATLKSHDRTNMLKSAIAKTISDTHDHKAEATIHELEDQGNKLMSELEVATAEIGSLKQDIITKVEMIKSLQDEKEATELRLSETKERLKSANQDKVHLTYQLNDTSHTLVKTKNTLANTEVVLRATQAKLQKTEEDLVTIKENALGAAEFINEIQEFVATTTKSALSTLDPPLVVVADDEDSKLPEVVDEPPITSENAAYSFFSIRPTFTVLNWEKAEPIMADFVEKTKSEKGCVYYGWTRVGDKLKCREAYVDGQAVNDHLTNVGDCITALLAEGVATLDNIEIDCTANGINVVKPGTEALGTTYYTIDDGFTNLKELAGDLIQPYTFCSIHPTFTVLDWDKAKPIMAEFINTTRTERGCLYYGWTLVGDKLTCREGYVDGASVNAHLKNVGDSIGALLSEGIAKLISIEIHGPSDQLELVKPGTKDLGTTYFSIHSGFSRFVEHTFA